MMNKRIFLLLCSALLVLISIQRDLYAAPPIPARIGGSVTVDCITLTNSTDTGYTFTVTKLNDTDYNPVAEDTDGLNDSDWYIIDIPIFESTDQPGGAQPEETAVIHVYLNGVEHLVTSPVNGQLTVGNSGTTNQVDIAAKITKPHITVTDSLAPIDDLQLPFGNLTEGLSLERAVMVTNSGSGDLIIGSITQNHTSFSISSDNCSGMTLLTGESCTLTVAFSPTIGTFSDSFDIPSNDCAPVTINVSGTGLSSASNNPPSISKLVYPADGQQELGTSLTFKWEKSSDPDLDTIIYYLYYSEDVNFIGSSPIQVVSLNKSKTFFAWNSIGLSFFGIALVGGIKGRKKLLILLIMTALIAVLLVSCGSGGGGGGESSSPSPSTPQPSNEMTQVISGLNSGTTYYWKVVVDDGNGGVAESDVQSFNTL